MNIINYLFSLDYDEDIHIYCLESYYNLFKLNIKFRYFD